MRRQVAEQDAQVLREKGPADDFDCLVQWSSAHLEVEGWSVRKICLVRLDTTRPALVLTHEAVRAAMTKVTVAPISTTIEGLSSEVPVGPWNGLDHNCVVALDNVITVPVSLLGRTVDYLSAEQEAQVARAVVLAYDLELPLLGWLARVPTAAVDSPPAHSKLDRVDLAPRLFVIWANPHLLPLPAESDG